MWEPPAELTSANYGVYEPDWFPFYEPWSGLGYKINNQKTLNSSYHTNPMEEKLLLDKHTPKRTKA